jgi:EAL domain-containing protein (putative c-di-GMP-specific phosphodiesterase class I)
MRSGEVVGMEALLRWQHPERGLLSPGEFLPAAEQTDLIVDIGEWVIEQALIQIGAWLSAGKAWPISVNIAARHFHRPDFLDRLKDIFACHPNVPPRLLEIEILESVALGDINYIRDLIVACQALGVKFSLDDFGTGYSSLSYLKRLPADTLKIDQSFVRDMLDDKEDLALIEAVIGLSTAFDRRVVAEGVETVEHGVLLMRLGCVVGQGYGIARPMPAENVLDWAARFVPPPIWTLWNQPWNMRDLPLLTAKHDYLGWIRQILAATKENSSTPFPRKKTDHVLHLRFSEWYHGIGKERYGHLPEFAAMMAHRERSVRMGREIIQLYEAGKIAEANSLGQALAAFNDEVIANLDALQAAWAREIPVYR